MAASLTTDLSFQGHGDPGFIKQGLGKTPAKIALPDFSLPNTSGFPPEVLLMARSTSSHFTCEGHMSGSQRTEAQKRAMNSVS